jgi:exopolyphosphatase / guanosine-5'-triphosphate,3'-diphosphate pyrophosphatase
VNDKLATMRRAVIDIGTNTVKLLVADVADGNVAPVVSKDITTRLGEGVHATKRLSRVAIARTIQTIDEFLNEAHQRGAQHVVALTTSAVRDAENRDEFLDGVRCQCELEVQVVTGDREAELIFRGVSSDPEWSDQPILVLDVGGGSSEFIQGQRGKIERLQSLPLGAVRLTEQHGENYDALGQFLRRMLLPSLKNYNGRDRRVIGTGGTITTMARIQAARTVSSQAGESADLVVDRTTLTLDWLRALVSELRALPLVERRKVRGLPPERADIIVAGGAVFVVAMELLGAAELIVSIRNLRYGALVEG